MIPWLVAALAGALGAAAQYGRGALGARVAPLALLRALSVALVVALLLAAPARPPHRLAADVALDGSESWLRAAPGCTAFAAALDSARRAGGQLSRFGDSLRADGTAPQPTDRASSLRAVADRASATGRPVLVVTDGELDDADAAAQLPSGSRALVIPCAPAPDAAVASLDAPRTLLAGDTISATVTLVAGAAGAPAGRLELALDDATLAAEPVAALAPFAERAVALRGVATGTGRAALLRAVFHGAGDREPRNDTLSLGVDVSTAPAAVFVSTAPDYDSREAVAALRGVTSLPTRAYYRVAPGNWRGDGALARVDERTVREAVRDAPLVVLHGDTAAFGAPRAASRAALLLFAPPSVDDGEWFVAGAPPSPVAASLSGLSIDSLPPLAVSRSLPAADWVGVVARRGGSTDERRPVLAGWDAPRRIAVLGASGFWRWRFRGGVRADAYAALFGSLYDWLAAGRSDRRVVVPEGGVSRAGDPVRWRRGGTIDSAATVVLSRRGGAARGDTVLLRFAGGATITESPALPAGVYEAHMAGGVALLAVNASREMIPRRPTIRSGTLGGAVALAAGESLRELGWVYALVVLLLCSEWLLRRRAGLR